MKRSDLTVVAAAAPARRRLARQLTAAASFVALRRLGLGLVLPAAGIAAGCNRSGDGGASGSSAAGASAAASKRPSFRSTDITGAEYAKTLALTDQDGKPRSLADFKGKVVMVFFGFTQCPDVCPLTLVKAAEVRRLLGDEGK